MNKITKIMTAVGVMGAMAGIGTYMYMNCDKNKCKKYMNYIMK